MRRQIGLLLAPALLLIGCSASPAFVATTPSATLTASSVTTQAPSRTQPSRTQPSGTQPSGTQPSGASTAKADDAVVIVGTGDIAEGGRSTMANAASTADLVRAAKPRLVFAVGDNAYPDGSATDYATKYDPTWGSFKAITRPVPGNHEYHSTPPSGYLGYFGAANVTNSVDGGVYYAYDIGKHWRAYALNSEISMSKSSAQYAWLTSDLNAHPGRHFAAYWHQPRFVSKVEHGDRKDETALWDLLLRHGTDIVMSGHEHHAERFAKMDGSGALDPQGIRQFITGNGGNQIYGVPKSLRANSEFANGYDYGVLKLTLRPNSYDWAFIASGRAYNGSASIVARTKGLVLDSGRAATNTTLP